ncbi:MAG: sugar porter family MFS transporter [Kiritimatiellae bacterium]|nr:sugar porter family MFS transporter [Kiritimatiellia bacterium]
MKKNLSIKLLVCTVVAALGGLLFGYDTAVISGADKPMQALWQTDGWTHGLVMSSALWGTVIGALIGGLLSDRFGRKRTLFGSGVMFFISAVWSAFPTGPYTMTVARLIGGFAVGISSVVVPLYNSEIAPPNYRGTLTGLFQFNVIFGMCIAYISNYFMARLGDNAWRYMLGSEALPAFLFTALCPFLVESPRWLIAKRNDIKAGQNVFIQINPKLSEEEIGTMVKGIIAECGGSHQDATGGTGFFSKPLLKPILLAFLVAFFNQMSGINAVLYFAPRIFGEAGFATNDALFQSAGIGIVMFIGTWIGVALIDVLGRKTLLLLGGIGYVISLALCVWGFASGHGTWIPWFLFAFVAAHGLGQGTVIWVLISEIFPNRYRGAGQSLGSSTHWIFAALIAFTFPKLAECFSQSAIFSFFLVMMVIHIIWILTMVPETKGKVLEEINV